MRSVSLDVGVLLLAGLCSSCGESSATAPTPEAAALDLPTPASFAEEHGSFASYWHQGVAELSRYSLRQARYGETHEGEAVLVFVTEPFLPDAQVKDDDGDAPDAIAVLKLNAYRRFYTGIYPYSVLTSTFTPEEGGPTLKVTGSVQEWCGHAYTQINRRDGQLELAAHSYFEAEADEARTMPEAALEDGLFAALRRDPSELPTGAVELVPAMHYLRFRHKPARAHAAMATRERARDERFGTVGRYQVRYPELGRELTITYGLSFPHAILGWVDDGPEGRTEAVRTHAILTDYWSHHGADDGAYRAALGLTE